MWRITKIGIICITAAIVLLTVPVAEAKKASEPAPAPIPVQILTGKKVFISNGESNTATEIPNQTYNEFYASMKSWGKYELVEAPADADLVFEIHFVTFTGRKGPFGYGNPVVLQFHLLILDPKTRIVLWAFTEDVEGAILEGTARKNFDQAMAYLVDDVKSVTTPPAAVPDAPAPGK
jgi:hypothetical protein